MAHDVDITTYLSGQQLWQRRFSIFLLTFTLTYTLTHTRGRESREDARARTDTPICGYGGELFLK